MDKSVYQFFLRTVQVREADAQLLEGIRSIDRRTTGAGKLDNGLVTPRESRGVLKVDRDHWGRPCFVHGGCNEQNRKQSSMIGLCGQSQLELRHFQTNPKSSSKKDCRQFMAGHNEG